MENKCNFSFKHYIECLRMIASSKVEIELIHDIDHLTSNIEEFLKIEDSFDLQSTSFIRLHAKNYNPLSFENITRFSKLFKNSKIGLHFEPSFYKKEQISAAIQKEREILELSYTRSINALSIHEPARFGSIDCAQIPNSMKYYCHDSNYYQDKKYISDSGGRWREGCMCQHIGKHEKMIVLTHPLWWYNETSAENY